MKSPVFHTSIFAATHAIFIFLTTFNKWGCVVPHLKGFLMLNMSFEKTTFKFGTSSASNQPNILNVSHFNFIISNLKRKFTLIPESICVIQANFHNGISMSSY